MDKLSTEENIEALQHETLTVLPATLPNNLYRIYCESDPLLVPFTISAQIVMFSKHFREPLAVLRLLHYSNEVSDINRGIFACGAHSDYGMVTLLATDDQPGLQIYHEGNWIDIPPPGFHEGKFVVNLGDMLERWTNGRFKSTLHRVIRAKSDDRYSIPFFYEPHFDTYVECLESCIGEEGAKYAPITSGEHLIGKYKETHADFKV